MSLEAQKIQHEIEAALQALSEARGQELARQIRPILLANLERGRVEHFAGGKAELIPAYVQRVADGFTALNGLIHQIQSERSTDVWMPLFERMQLWAYNFFLRKGFGASDETQEIASECATEAALSMLNAYFPYDTEFDPWAHIIVQNACRKYIDRAFKKSVVPEDQIVPLDDNLAGSAGLLVGGHELSGELADELKAALAQLTEARRAVIQMIYFDDLGAEEVARKLRKSVGAVYSLQFNALQDLRKILSTIRDSLNE